MVIFNFWRKVTSLWRHPGRRESRIHFRFSVSGRAWPVLLELSARFGWKLQLPVWWATENCEKIFRSYILAVFVASLACHSGCPRPPAKRSEAGGGRAMRPLTDHRIWTTSGWIWPGYECLNLVIFGFSDFGGVGETLYSQKWQDRHIIFILCIRAWVVDLWLCKLFRKCVDRFESYR